MLFDCLEFDEALASIDTLYDLAFLLMDLLHQERGALAQRLLNGYLDATWDDGGVALLPLFLACRAAIRAKVLGLGGAGSSKRIRSGGSSRGAGLPGARARLSGPPRPPAWSRSAASPAPASRRWRASWPRSSGLLRARWCCAATRCASACTVWRPPIGCRR